MNISEQLKKGKEQVCLLINTPKVGQFTTDIFVGYVNSKESKHNDSISFHDNSHSEKNKFKGLKVVVNTTSEGKASNWEIKAGDFEYLNAISYDDAIEVIETLRPIKRKLSKLDQKLGEPLTFDVFISRLAKVLKVKAFYTHKDNNSQFVRSESMSEFEQEVKTIFSL
jgi:hypothetical protein